MTVEQSALIERIRNLICDESAVREVSMFGGRSVMVDDRMLVSALRDGGLLVRIDPDRHDELLGRPGAEQAQMGRGRSMGPGWIEVAADAIREEVQLSSWITTALEHHRMYRHQR